MKPIFITIVILTNVLRFELAQTEEEREKGLMGRKNWGNIDGMLFIHDKPEEVSYWMKSTYLELCMIFMDRDFRPLEVYRPETLSTKIIFSSNTNIKYVLELNPSYSNVVFENMKLFAEKLRKKLSN
ncbi:MAG: DUF192 domain-containing protein [Brevinematia bacterium]